MTLRWDPVAGAGAYQYSIKNLNTQQIITTGVTEELKSPPLNQASEPLTSYEWQLSAGIKDRNDNWVFGPAAVDKYDIHLPKPINLSPENQTVALDADRSVSFSWEAIPNATQYRFSLYKKIDGRGSEAIIQNKIITENTIIVENLEYETVYEWYVAGIGPNPDCVNPSKAEFNTQKSPARYDLGFFLYVKDLYGPNKQVIPGSFIYTVEVIRPDGTLDFKHDAYANDPLQVGFSAGNPAQVVGGLLNGQILDQDGDYLVRLTIKSVFSGMTELADRPEVIFKAQEYIKETGQNWKLNEEISPNPADSYFPGRVVGSSVHFKFHYEKPN